MLAHLLLDALEVRVGDRDALGELEVVVEAVLDRRADRDLHAGIELHHRGREHVRGVVADDVERVLVRRRDDLDRAVGDRAVEVAHLAVLLDRERGAREAGADGRGDVAPVAPSASSSSLPSGRMTFTGAILVAKSVPPAPATVRGWTPPASAPSSPSSSASPT